MPQSVDATIAAGAHRLSHFPVAPVKDNNAPKVIGTATFCHLLGRAVSKKAVRCACCGPASNHRDASFGNKERERFRPPVGHEYMLNDARASDAGLL